MKQSKYIKHKKAQRLNYPGHYHELTFSCYKNRPFLKSERACKYLADAINRAMEIFNFDVLAYVFMPTHVHMIIRPNKDVYDISEILKYIKQSVSRKILLYLRENNPKGLKLMETGRNDKQHRFWQAGGGYDRNIISYETLSNSINYVHNNPVRKEYVSGPEDWKWSSARDWSGKGRDPIKVSLSI